MHRACKCNDVCRLDSSRPDARFTLHLLFVRRWFRQNPSMINSTLRLRSRSHGYSILTFTRSEKTVTNGIITLSLSTQFLSRFPLFSSPLRLVPQFGSSLRCPSDFNVMIVVVRRERLHCIVWLNYELHLSYNVLQCSPLIGSTDNGSAIT